MLSVGTLDDEVWRGTEPGTPRPIRRLEAVARLNEAGIPCGVLVAPVLPGRSDAPEQLEAVVGRRSTPVPVPCRRCCCTCAPGVRDHDLGRSPSNVPT